MNNIEILSPVGSFENLISAVQSGANAVYFGANEIMSNSSLFMKISRYFIQGISLKR